MVSPVLYFNSPDSSRSFLDVYGSFTAPAKVDKCCGITNFAEGSGDFIARRDLAISLLVAFFEQCGKFGIGFIRDVFFVEFFDSGCVV